MLPLKVKSKYELIESPGAKPVPYADLTDDTIAEMAARPPLLPGMARAKALAHLADPHAPPPTTLAHAVHKQRRAVAGSKWLYGIISKIAQLVGVDLVVLPGGVKKLPRTVFKCGVYYDCDLSQITDQVRCTVVCESLAQVAAMLRALLASTDVFVVRVKNRFAPDYDAKPAGGYLDLQTIVVFECGGSAGEWMMGEVQVNLWSMLRIKEAPGGGHKVFNFARSLRAYDEATCVYKGKLVGGVAARIAAGALLEADLSFSDCKTEKQQVELARALASSTCRVATLGLCSNKIRGDGAVALADALKANTSVIEIDLHNNEIWDSGAVALADALKTNTSVTTINLRRNTIGNSGAVALADALKANTSVIEIILSENVIGDAGAVELADALKTNNTVAKIDLSWNKIGDSGAVALADALKTNTSFTKIELWGNKIGDAGAVALADVLKANTSVTEILLGSNKIGDAGAVALADALKTNTSVTKIDLSGSEIGDAGAVALADGLKTNTSVTTVYLNANEIGDAGAVALADVLKANTSVTDIILCSNKIGDAGAVALADALKTNTSVTRIDLMRNTIGNTGAVALADALKTNTSVTAIFLSYNEIGPDGERALDEVDKPDGRVTSECQLRSVNFLRQAD
jgi:Ran GTPase-activating protein (RanGAP) involved in mRNA processing and transport